MRKQTGSRNRGWLPMIRRRLENYGGHVGNRLSVAAGVVLAAGMMAAFAPRAEAAMQMPITFTNDARLNTLANFPALVILDTDKVNYSQFLANGQDLRFYDASARELKYEVESWMSSASALSNSYIWVQVPSMTAGCVIYAYWGNPSAPFPAYRTNGLAWETNYKSVWHMKEAATGSAGDFKDSTTNGRNSLNTTDQPTQSTSGKIGNGLTFGNSTTTKITFNSVSLDTAYTVSTWFKKSGTQSQGMILSKAGAGYETPMFIEDQGGRGLYSSTASTENYVSWAGDTAWHLFSVRRNGTNIRFYIDGAEVGSPGKTCDSGSVSVDLVGQYGGATGYGFKGILDELRLSTIVRSTDWVWAEYANVAQQSAFVTCGAVTTVSQPAATGGTVTNYTTGTGLNQTNWTAHIFTNTAASTSLVFSVGGKVEYLVVGGGGGGGYVGGGGGAGGYRCSVSGESSGGGASAESSLTVTAGTYAVTVGTGGSGTIYSVSSTGAGGDGGSSSFGNITASGGGGGGGYDTLGKGRDGGSGGGSGSTSDLISKGYGTANQGYDGGEKGQRVNYGTAGGGGAGSVGANSPNVHLGGGGNGGTGVTSSITGTAVARAGGGGGGAHNTGNGGTAVAGGGNGGDPGTNGSNATDNTGGGGGGSAAGTNGGNGGSGIVIVRYGFKVSPKGTVIMMR